MEEARSLAPREEPQLRPEHLELAFLSLQDQGALDFADINVKALYRD